MKNLKEMVAILIDLVTEISKFLKERVPLTTEPEKLLCTEQAAELIGVSVSSVRRYSKSGKLPSKKMGGNLCFFLSEVIAFINRR